jgi:hypothetical protein
MAMHESVKQVTDRFNRYVAFFTVFVISGAISDASLATSLPVSIVSRATIFVCSIASAVSLITPLPSNLLQYH